VTTPGGCPEGIVAAMRRRGRDALASHAAAKRTQDPDAHGGAAAATGLLPAIVANRGPPGADARGGDSGALAVRPED